MQSEKQQGYLVFFWSYLLKPRWFRLKYPADSHATCVLQRSEKSSEHLFDKCFEDLGDVSVKDKVARVVFLHEEI